MNESSPTQPDPSGQTPVQRRTRIALFLAWLVFLVSTAIPAWLSLLAFSLVMVWLVAVYSLLHTGGLSGSDTMFTGGVCVGSAVWAVSLLGVILRRLGTSRATQESRQRVMGPGGRVLRLVYQRDEAVTTKPLLSWIPDLPILAALFFLVVRLGEWDGNRALPDVLSLVLILANLYLLLVYIPLWLGRFGWRLVRGLYTFSGRSSFRAGMFTILFLLPSGLEIARFADDTESVSTQASQNLEQADERIDRVAMAESLPEFWRRAFLETADAFWSERAFDAEIRHFLIPLFDAAQDPYDAQRLSSARSRPHDWLVGLEQVLLPNAWAQESEDAFATCVRSLYPAKVGRAARRVRRDYRLSDDDSDDVALGALLSICTNYESRAYPNLEAAYFLAVGRSAKKMVDPRRKYRREVTSSALGSMFADCSEPSDFIDRCAGPWSSPEEQVASWEEISMVKWCELNRLQRTVIVQKAILEMSDVEIADLHTGMSPARAKDTYQNARKKVRDKLSLACRDF